MKKFLQKNPGQITLINLLVIVVVMIMFFTFLPIILNMTSTYAVPAIAGSSADAATKDILTAIVHLFSVVIAIAILITVLNYSIPRRDYGG
jgi:uncharacterized membrane protein